MANIRRKNKQFQVRLTVKGKSISATFPTREAATAWAAPPARHFSSANTPTSNARRHTFGQLLGRYSEKITPTKRGQRQDLQRTRMLRSHPITQRIAGELASMEFADLRDDPPRLIADQIASLCMGATAACEVLVSQPHQYAEMQQQSWPARHQGHLPHRNECATDAPPARLRP